MLDAAGYEQDVFGTPVPNTSASPAGDPSLGSGTGGVGTGGVGTGVSGAGDVGTPGSGTGGCGAVLSPAVAALRAAAGAVVAQVPAELPQAQALADATALLEVVEQLRGACLTRVADVDARQLHVLDGAGSTATWVGQQRT